jgi:hypothetical protein
MRIVSKEYVDDYSKGKLFKGVLPILLNDLTVDEFRDYCRKNSSNSLLNCLYLLELIKVRELVLLKELTKINKQHSKSRESIFDIWMQKGSNIIQQLAEVFGERVCLEFFSND